MGCKCSKGYVYGTVGLLLPVTIVMMVTMMVVMILVMVIQCKTGPTEAACEGGGDLQISVNDLPLPFLGPGTIPSAYYLTMQVRGPAACESGVAKAESSMSHCLVQVEQPGEAFDTGEATHCLGTHHGKLIKAYAPAECALTLPLTPTMPLA